MAGHVIQGLSEETASILSCLDCSTLDMTKSSSTPHINYKKFIEKKSQLTKDLVPYPMALAQKHHILVFCYTPMFLQPQVPS